MAKKKRSTELEELDALGRPGYTGHKTSKINENDVYKLATMLCTNDEIAAFFGVTAETIEQNFLPLIQKGRENGRASLRRMQWLSAQEGNVSMQIFLGKSLLKQRDWGAIEGGTTVIVRGAMPSTEPETEPPNP